MCGTVLRVPLITEVCLVGMLGFPFCPGSLPGSLGNPFFKIVGFPVFYMFIQGPLRVVVLIDDNNRRYMFPGLFRVHLSVGYDDDAVIYLGKSCCRTVHAADATKIG